MKSMGGEAIIFREYYVLALLILDPPPAAVMVFCEYVASKRGTTALSGFLTAATDAYLYTYLLESYLFSLGNLSVIQLYPRP